MVVSLETLIIWNWLTWLGSYLLSPVPGTAQADRQCPPRSEKQSIPYKRLIPMIQRVTIIGNNGINIFDFLSTVFQTPRSSRARRRLRAGAYR